MICTIPIEFVLLEKLNEIKLEKVTISQLFFNVQLNLLNSKISVLRIYRFNHRISKRLQGCNFLKHPTNRQILQSCCFSVKTSPENFQGQSLLPCFQVVGAATSVRSIYRLTSPDLFSPTCKLIPFVQT